MHRDVTYIEAVEDTEKVLSKAFIHHFTIGKETMSGSNERVHALRENYAKYRFNGTRYRCDADICTYGAIKYLTSLKNQRTINLEHFMVRSIFTLHQGPVWKRELGYYRWHHERSPS